MFGVFSSRQPPSSRELAVSDAQVHMQRTRQEFRDRQQSDTLEPLSQAAEFSARSIAQRKRRGREAALRVSIAQALSDFGCL